MTELEFGFSTSTISATRSPVSKSLQVPMRASTHLVQVLLIRDNYHSLAILNILL